MLKSLTSFNKNGLTKVSPLTLFSHSNSFLQLFKKHFSPNLKLTPSLVCEFDGSIPFSLVCQICCRIVVEPFDFLHLRIVWQRFRWNRLCLRLYLNEYLPDRKSTRLNS